MIAVIPGDFPPQYIIDENGNPTGFAIDVMNEIAALAGTEVVYRVADDWKTASDILVSGKADLIPNTGISPARDEYYDYTAPVETFSVSFFAREASQFPNGLDDLAGRMIGLERTNVAYRILKDRADLELVPVSTNRDALFDLLAGHVDAIVGPAPVIRKLAREIRVEDRIRRIGEPLIEVKRAIAVREGDAQLLRRLEPAVERFVHSDAYRAIYAEWYGQPEPYWTVARVAWTGVGLILAVLISWAARHHLLTVSFNRRLRQSEEVLQEHVTQLEAAHEVLEKQNADLVRFARDLQFARDQAEVANRTKTQFLATMSHELRTPLNAIIGFSEVIKDAPDGAVRSSKSREYARDIHSSGRHLLSLINDILDLSKVESGAAELHEETLEVASIVQSTLTLVRSRAASVGVEIVPQIDNDLPALRADGRKLKQILANLLSNAVKFTNSGGEVVLKVWCRSDSGFVFQIIDNGIGMAPEHIPKALMAFGQVDSHLARKFEGTGLGLPLSKSLIELHGGTLDLQSQPGMGTTVTVRLPATRIVRQMPNVSGLDASERAAG